MIKFTDNALVAGQFFTPGMIAEFATPTEEYLIRDGYAVAVDIEVGGTVEFATTAGHADTADSATTALSANTATTATTAGHATTADSAGSATTADTATTAGHATSADTAATASHATTATTATTALNAITADSADTAASADTATTAGHATTADSATTAATATSATTAVTATTATTADKAAALLLNSSDLVYPELGQPVECLSAAAIAVSCSLTGIDEPLETFVILASMVGANSVFQIEPLWTFTSSANNKILKVKVGGVTVYSATRTTSTREAPLIVLANRNSLTSQIQPYDNGYVTAGTGTPATYSIDFSKNVIVQITGQRANSGDSLKLEYYRAQHFVGA